MEIIRLLILAYKSKLVKQDQMGDWEIILQLPDENRYPNFRLIGNDKWTNSILYKHKNGIYQLNKSNQPHLIFKLDKPYFKEIKDFDVNQKEIFLLTDTGFYIIPK